LSACRSDSADAPELLPRLMRGAEGRDDDDAEKPPDESV
jgi:hypothetical protein